MKRKSVILVLAAVIIVGLVVASFAIKPAARAQDGEEQSEPIGTIGEITTELRTMNENFSRLIQVLAEEEVIEWRGQSSGDHYLSPLQRISVVVATASGGRLKLNVAPAGTFYPAQEEFDGVHGGVIDFAVSGMPSWSDHFPGETLQLFSTKIAGFSPMGQYLWLTSWGGTELLREMIGGYNVRLIPGGGVLGPPEVFLHSSVPINAPDDLAGLRIRAAGTGGVILSRMDAEVYFIPGGEIYEAMEGDVIDAFEFAYPTLNWEMRFQEVAEYVYVSGSRIPSTFDPFIVNENSWEELPDDLKLIVEEVTREEAIRYYSEMVASDIEHLQYFREYPRTVELLSPQLEEEFIEQANTFYDELAASDIFAEKVLTSLDNFEQAFWGTTGLRP